MKKEFKIINLKFKIPAAKRDGQALVVLLVFVSTATIITAAAVTVAIINARSTGSLAQGDEALMIAEAGAENAIIRIIRDPAGTYANEPPITVGNGTAQITVTTNGTTKTIISAGTVGSFTRKVQITGTFNTGGDNKFQLTSWQEIN